MSFVFRVFYFNLFLRLGWCCTAACLIAGFLLFINCYYCFLGLLFGLLLAQVAWLFLVLVGVCLLFCFCACIVAFGFWWLVACCFVSFVGLLVLFGFELLCGLFMVCWCMLVAIRY